MLKETWTGMPVKQNNLQTGNVQKLFCKDATVSFPSYSEGSGCMIEAFGQNCANDPSGRSCAQSHSHARAGVHNRLADGLYGPQIQLYSTVFARKQLLILQFEAMLGDQARTLESVSSFLGVSSTSARRLKSLPTDNTADG